MAESKVTIPKEVAEAIEELRSIGIRPFGIIQRLDKRMKLGETGLQPHLNVISAWKNEEPSNRSDKILSALVNGYEVEKYPEDRLLEYYRSLKQAEDMLKRSGITGSLQFLQGRQSVETTLNILGITVEGING